MNQKNLFDAEYQAVQQDNLGKRTAGTQGLDAPLQATERQAMLHRLVEGIEERAQRLQNGTPDRRTHDREKRVRQCAGILAHRFAQRRFHRGQQRVAQGFFAAFLTPEVNGFRKDGADVAGAQSGILDTLAQTRQILLLGRED